MTADGALFISFSSFFAFQRLHAAEIRCETIFSATHMIKSVGDFGGPKINNCSGAGMMISFFDVLEVRVNLLCNAKHPDRIACCCSVYCEPSASGILLANPPNEEGP